MSELKLDLEFEDEEEIKQKELEAKKEAMANVEVVDLEFVSADEADMDDLEIEPKAPVQEVDELVIEQKVQPAKTPEPDNVQPIRAKKPKPIQRVEENVVTEVSSSSSAHSLELAIVEAQTYLIAEHAQKAKEIEIKINQILSMMVKKNPAMKKDAIRISKLLADHSRIRKKAA